MQEQDSKYFTRRMLGHVLAGSSDRAAQAMPEQGGFYTDLARWQQEKTQFFMQTPQVVGFAGEVAAHGSYATFECLGVPLVICRNEQGELNAFVNACAHRAARVAEGCGVARRLTCRFHGWSYNLSGKLAGRPDDKAFAPACANDDLISLPVSDKWGVLVVGISPAVSQEAVDSALDDIGPVLAGYDFTGVASLETRRYEVAANWKLVTDLSHESYHFRVLHRDSLAPLMTAHTVLDDFGRHTRWGFPLKGIERLQEQDESQWPSSFPGVINHTLFPSTLLITSGRDAQLIRAEPGSEPGKSVVYYAGVCRDPATRAESLAAYQFGGDIFSTEDLPAAEQCQQGIAAGREHLSIGRNEPVVQLWHQKWRQELQGHSSGE